MKVSKLTFIIIATGAMFLSSCNHDELTITDEQQNLVAAPTFSGTIAQLADVNATLKTRAGVIEDNPDYADGELFYWHNNDQIKVLFFKKGDLTSTPSELVYTAVVPDGTKPNSCEFTTTESIAPGDYAVYALYPAQGWSKEEGRYKASFNGLGPQQDGFMFLFEEASSAHLKDGMFMKADVGNVSISNAGVNKVTNLKFKHLTSVIRFHVTSNYEGLSVEAGSSLSLTSLGKFFQTSAYLTSIDGMDTEYVPGSLVSNLVVYPTIVVPFMKQESTWIFDYYMPVFPTAMDTSGEELKIDTYITYKEVDNSIILQEQTFGMRYGGLSFANDLNFMPNGFEAGKSYYFNLRAENP